MGGSAAEPDSDAGRTNRLTRDIWEAAQRLVTGSGEAEEEERRIKCTAEYAPGRAGGGHIQERTM